MLLNICSIEPYTPSEGTHASISLFLFNHCLFRDSHEQYLQKIRPFHVRNTTPCMVYIYYLRTCTIRTNQLYIGKNTSPMEHIWVTFFYQKSERFTSGGIQPLLAEEHHGAIYISVHLSTWFGVSSCWTGLATSTRVTW